MIKYKPISLPDITATTDTHGRIYHTPVGNLPSITTVLSSLSKEGIDKWKTNVGEEKANRISTAAKNFGTTIHEMCENYIKGEKVHSPTPLHFQSFNNIRMVLNKNLTTVYGLELPLYSKYLGVAGRCDCIGIWNGKLCVIDFKTANKYKKKEWIHSYFLQATAYCLMIEELTEQIIDRFVIIITVEGETAQVFEGRRNDYIKDLIKTIKDYYNEKNLIHSYPKLFSLI